MQKKIKEKDNPVIIILLHRHNHCWYFSIFPLLILLGDYWFTVCYFFPERFEVFQNKNTYTVVLLNMLTSQNIRNHVITEDKIQRKAEIRWHL